MDNQDNEWRASLKQLKQKAANDKINIDSCLGQNEVDLLQQFTKNSDGMKACSNKFIDANSASANKFYDEVSHH